MCGRSDHARQRPWARRMPSRAQLLEHLEERQRDLEEEIADIHDLIRRLRDAGGTASPGGASDPQPAI